MSEASSSPGQTVRHDHHFWDKPGYGLFGEPWCVYFCNKSAWWAVLGIGVALALLVNLANLGGELLGVTFVGPLLASLYSVVSATLVVPLAFAHRRGNSLTFRQVIQMATLRWKPVAAVAAVYVLVVGLILTGVWSVFEGGSVSPSPAAAATAAVGALFGLFSWYFMVFTIARILDNPVKPAPDLVLGAAKSVLVHPLATFGKFVWVAFLWVLLAAALLLVLSPLAVVATLVPAGFAVFVAVFAAVLVFAGQWFVMVAACAPALQATHLKLH